MLFEKADADGEELGKGVERAAESETNVGHDASRLFVEHHAALLRYLWRLTGEADVAEDAAQETFVRLVEKPPEPGETRAWLFTVGKNVALDALRTRARRLRLLCAAPDRTPLADPPPMPDAVAEAASARDLVREALEGLTEREQRILRMRAEGYVHHEIAEAVGTTSGSVATMFARALRKLRAETRNCAAKRMREGDGGTPAQGG